MRLFIVCGVQTLKAEFRTTYQLHLKASASNITQYYLELRLYCQLTGVAVVPEGPLLNSIHDSMHDNDTLIGRGDAGPKPVRQERIHEIYRIIV